VDSLQRNRSNLKTLTVIFIRIPQGLTRPRYCLTSFYHNSHIVSEKELQKLYKNFSKIDKDKSGMLEPEEFFDIPGKP
jgi:hypothetical protein